MKRLLMVIGATAFAASAAFAQGPGPGKGPGKGPGWNFNGDNTRGWPMMSREERSEHRSQMLSMKSYEECVAYLEEHRKLMEARAKERGRPGPGLPAQNMCERMKQAGRFG
jgi:Spy/CpxP family protein refolding chaperone